MTDSDIESVVKRLIAEVCDTEPDSIASGGLLLGYGLDSVRALELLLAVEEDLGVEVDEHDPELAKVKTVDDMVKLVQRRRAPK